MSLVATGFYTTAAVLLGGSTLKNIYQGGAAFQGGLGSQTAIKISNFFLTYSLSRTQEGSDTGKKVYFGLGCLGLGALALNASGYLPALEAEELPSFFRRIGSIMSNIGLSFALIQGYELVGFKPFELVYEGVQYFFKGATMLQERFANA